MHVIVLAHAKDFCIGPVTAYPSTRTLVRDERREILEPRVMQVLTVLAQAPNEVASRDDLIEQCWAGRIVGDDAINRVISRLRRTAEGIGAGVFAIDTITRVGYRLRLLDGATVEPSDHSAASSPRAVKPGASTDGGVVSRRKMLLGGGAAALTAAASAWFWPRRRTNSANPQAALLAQKGTDVLQSNDVFAADDPGSLGTAIALLTAATNADPKSATAWGSLALAYAALKRVSRVSQRPGLDLRGRSAAEAALELNPHEPRATAAVLLLSPLYRHWRSAEQADRTALKTCLPIPLLLFLLSETLSSVGRCKEAAATSIKSDRKSFIIPGADRRTIVDLWAAGDVQSADEALKVAVDHWAQQPQVWRTRLAYLMYSGRPSDALALLDDEAERPPNTPATLMNAVHATASVLNGHGNAADAVKSNLAYLESSPAALFAVVHACAALGDLNTSFELLSGYYFGQGVWKKIAPEGGDQDRATSPLFQPPMKSAWTDRRFGQLVWSIGLEDYWRRSGTVPDFRRRL